MGIPRVKERLRDARAYLLELLPEGQGLVEYALILMFVGMVVILILAVLGHAIGNIFSNIIPQL